jgi:hypothetical protein
LIDIINCIFLENLDEKKKRIDEPSAINIEHNDRFMTRGIADENLLFDGHLVNESVVMKIYSSVEWCVRECRVPVGCARAFLDCSRIFDKSGNVDSADRRQMIGNDSLESKKIRTISNGRRQCCSTSLSTAFLARKRSVYVSIRLFSS